MKPENITLLKQRLLIVVPRSRKNIPILSLLILLVPTPKALMAYYQIYNIVLNLILLCFGFGFSLSESGLAFDLQIQNPAFPKYEPYYFYGPIHIISRIGK